MSPMPKGRGAGIDVSTRSQHAPRAEVGAPSRRRTALPGAGETGPFARAFADALRDILVDEMRPTG